MVASLRNVNARNVIIGPAIAPPPYPPGTFVYDSFTGTNGTPIISHTAEVGGPWTEASGQRNMIAAGYLMGITRTGSDTRVIPTAGVTGNWFFETEIYVNAIHSSDYVQGYQNSDLGFLFFIATDSIYFGDFGSVTPTFSTGNSYTIRFEFTGSSVELFIDDVSQGTDSLSFSPSGVISFDYFNCLPASSSDPVIASPDIDQGYEPGYALHMNYVLMAPLV